MSPCYVEKRIKISNSNLIQHRKNYTEKWQTTDINVRKLNIAINLFLDFFIVLLHVIFSKHIVLPGKTSTV